jgi:hypothetical protein
LIANIFLYAKSTSIMLVHISPQPDGQFRFSLEWTYQVPKDTNCSFNCRQAVPKGEHAEQF